MRCAVCKNNKWSQVTGLLERCVSCEFVKAKDIFFTADYDEIYSDDYYKCGDYYDYKAEETALKKNFENRLYTILEHKKSGELLDVGCGYGFFLELARSSYNVQGVERNKKLAHKVSQDLDLSIYGGDFLEYMPYKQYDIITAFDVIEHVPHPDLFIQKCFSATKDGGLLFLETGDIGAFLPKIQGRRWRLINPPEHLNYFNVKTLSYLLENNGYEILFIERVCFWRSLKQITFRAFHINPKLITFLPDISIPLKTYDIVFVGARKRGHTSTGFVRDTI